MVCVDGRMIGIFGVVINKQTIRPHRGENVDLDKRSSWIQQHDKKSGSGGTTVRFRISVARRLLVRPF